MAKVSMKELAAITSALADEMGLEYIDTTRTKEPGGVYLRVFLDKEGGLSLDDCEKYHRALLVKMEEIDYDFLEVSSPGIDRPLKTHRDYIRCAGWQVELRLFKALDGRRIYEGSLIGLADDMVSIDVGGEILSFAQKDIALVKPVFDEAELAAAQEVDFPAAENARTT